MASVAACSSTSSPTSSPSENTPTPSETTTVDIEKTGPVGRQSRMYQDDNRRAWVGDAARPLSTIVWYPAATGSVEKPWAIEIFTLGSNAVDSQLALPAKKYPLVVFSHGTGGSAIHFSWIAERLAGRGYIVAAVNHHGNTASEKSYLPAGFMLWWERATDVSVVIDKLLADPTFANHIDAERIGVGGFSLGGYTAIAVSGARTDRSQWFEFCAKNADNPACKLPPEASVSEAEVAGLATTDEIVQRSIARAGDSYKDDRVRATFVMAPALGPALTAASLKTVRVPVKVVVGAADRQAPSEFNAAPIAKALANAELVELANVGHYTFLSECTAEGRQYVKNLCLDEGVDRGATHQQVADLAVQFFEQHLPSAIP